MSIRDLNKLPLVALLALMAACGGGDEQVAVVTDEAPVAGTPTVEMPNAEVAPSPSGAAGGPVVPDAGGQVHEVRMVSTQGGASGVFEPATLTVKRGDVIRWIMADGVVMHNVSFTQAQGNPAGFSSPDSPFLTQEGQTYELKIDFPAGNYNYVCVPHAMTGMVGSVTVT